MCRTRSKELWGVFLGAWLVWTLLSMDFTGMNHNVWHWMFTWCVCFCLSFYVTSLLSSCLLVLPLWCPRHVVSRLVFSPVLFLASYSERACLLYFATQTSTQANYTACNCLYHFHLGYLLVTAIQWHRVSDWVSALDSADDILPPLPLHPLSTYCIGGISVNSRFLLWAIAKN